MVLVVPKALDGHTEQLSLGLWQLPHHFHKAIQRTNLDEDLDRLALLSSREIHFARCTEITILF
jgi:hypothetical protein